MSKWMENQPVTNFRAVRNKDGMTYLASGAYDASLAIDTLSADRKIAFDNADGTVLVQGASSINWGTVSVMPGGLGISDFRTTGVAVTGLRVGDQIVATMYGGANATAGLFVMGADCTLAGVLRLTMCNASTALTAIGPQIVKWVRLV